MAFNLLNLLQQVGASGLPGVEDGYAPDGSTDIVVPGRPASAYNPRLDPEPPQYNQPEMREGITPQYILNDDRMQPSPEELEELLPRKGMFGMKGTLRDILGTLGDAFLVQGGANRIYGPQRQMEREGDAMFGVTQNPMQAIERLAVHNPEAAQQLLQRVQQAQYQQGSLASQEAARQNQAQDRNYTNVSQARNQVARWLQAADTPEKQAFVIQQAQRLANELGVDVADFGLPGEGALSEGQRAILAAGDMTVNQQVQVPFTERRVSTGEYNAETGRINATRPRPARSQTELEYYQQVANIPPSQRTPEQNDFMKKYIQGTRGGRSLIPRNIAPTPGEQPRSRFRPVQ